MNLKIKVSSFFSSKTNKDGRSTLLLKFSYGYKEYANKKFVYKPLNISSGVSISKADWNNELLSTTNKYRQKHGNGVNNNIHQLIEKYQNAIKDCFRINKRLPHPDEAKRMYEEIYNETEDIPNYTKITDFIDATIIERTNLPITSVEHWKERTAKQYTNLKNHIKNYENANKLNIKHLCWENLNEKIYWDFFDVLNNIYFKEKGEYYRIVTIAKICKTLKSIYNVAIEKDLKIPLDLNKKKYKINAPNNPVHKATLSETELKRIIAEDVTWSKEFTQAKNYILISCLTGLRIEDMRELHTIEEFTDHKLSSGQNIKLFKTAIRKAYNKGEVAKVFIPIFKPVQEIIELNGGKFPKFNSEQNTRKVIKKFLKYLDFKLYFETTILYYNVENPVVEKKEIAEIFGPHDCRASFITNLKNMGVMSEIIEAITHPKFYKKNMIEHYDKSDDLNKALRLVDDINRGEESEVYCFQPHPVSPPPA